ncbi:MAG: dTDP-4-dehydrorhamnose reductase [Romboutsia sp.]|uniref:dTDP-4-dehydrorhamnose reductase n=1 Tax=Romboutsia sp. TaxID=1965302 RepID=UPI003F2D1E95
MNILLTGTTGQLGHDVLNEINLRGHNPIVLTRDELNLASLSDIKNTIISHNPDSIIHCAAYTQVDLAEDNKDICQTINSLAVKEIALGAKELNIPLIYLSTDYIFDGNKSSPYKEDDLANPINIYGKTKYEGELYIKNIMDKYFIVRISWVFGQNGNNFVKSMLKLSKEKKELSVVDDQIGSPTYTKDLAPLLIDMVESDKYGIYHATNEGFCSWYEFAKEAFKYKEITISLNPIKTSQYPTKAKRPLNSKLSKCKLSASGFKPLRHWKEALHDYIDTL